MLLWLATFPARCILIYMSIDCCPQRIMSFKLLGLAICLTLVALVLAEDVYTSRGLPAANWMRYYRSFAHLIIINSRDFLDKQFVTGSSI